MSQIIRSLSASGVFSGYFRRRTRRNKVPSDKPAAAVQASIANLHKGRDGHRTDPLSLAHQVDEYPATVAPFARYADDAVVYCSSKEQAEHVMQAIAARLAQCGLTMHPERSKRVYCHDSNRIESFPHVQFTFLGFAFRPRKAMSKQRRVFTSFLPGVSADALKRMRKMVRGWRIPRQTPALLAELAEQYNSVMRGWWEYYGSFSRCDGCFDKLIESLSNGPDASTRRCRGNLSPCKWRKSFDGQILREMLETDHWANS